VGAYEVTAFTWIGSVLLAICGAFQAFDVWRDNENARGLSWLFLITWGAGELWLLAGMLPIASLHVLANYAINTLIVFYMAGVKFSLPKRSGAEH
jgi:hypothetical protein